MSPDGNEFEGGAPDPPTSADALRRALTEDVERLVEQEPHVRKGVDPEAVHQARVATRRLRSQLRTFRGALRKAPLKRLAEPLKELAGLLGAVRDLDVLAMRLESCRDGVGDEPASVPARVVDDVLVKVGREREVAFHRLLSEMDSDRYHQLVDRLVGFAADPPFRKVARRPAAELLEPAVRLAWQRLERTVSSLPIVPGEADLHQVRIRAKRARYAAQAASPFGPPAYEQLAKRLGKLQDVLGLLNDGVHAVAWLRQAGTVLPEPAGAPAAELAHAGAALSGDSYLAGVGLLIAHQHLAMAAARDEWPQRWQQARAVAAELGWLAAE